MSGTQYATVTRIFANDTNTRNLQTTIQVKNESDGVKIMMKNEMTVINKNEVATVNETKTKVSNASKTNKTDIVATIDDLKKVFTKCGVLAKYSDGSHYVGCGTKCNSLSVNLLKTQYNVYCNDTNFDIVNSAKLTDTTCIKNGNSSDKTRPHTITVKSTKTLESVLKLVLANNSKIALVK